MLRDAKNADSGDTVGLSDEAAGRVVVDAQALIRRSAVRLIGRRGLTITDCDDIQQNVSLDLLRRLKRYDPRRASVATFVQRVVKHCCSSQLRELKAEKRSFKKLAGSLDVATQDGDGRPVDRSQTLPQAWARSHRALVEPNAYAFSECRQDVRHVVATLPPHLQGLCELLPEHSIAEIARRTNQSRRQVRRKIELLQRTFRRHGICSNS